MVAGLLGAMASGVSHPMLRGEERWQVKTLQQELRQRQDLEANKLHSKSDRLRVRIVYLPERTAVSRHLAVGGQLQIGRPGSDWYT